MVREEQQVRSTGGRRQRSRVAPPEKVSRGRPDQRAEASRGRRTRAIAQAYPPACSSRACKSAYREACRIVVHRHRLFERAQASSTDKVGRARGTTRAKQALRAAGDGEREPFPSRREIAAVAGTPRGIRTGSSCRPFGRRARRRCGARS